MEQALSLPEIRSLIGSFLSHHNRKTCALLSRAWAESISPWIWHSITINKVPSPAKLAVLHKNRTFVRTLNIGEFKALTDICKWFENLQSLHFRFVGHEMEIQGYTTELIRQNQSSLRKVIANFFGGETALVLRAVLECQSLKYLHHCHSKIQDRDMMGSFIKTCTQLTTLHLDYSNFLEETHLMLHGQMFFNLERVELEFVQGPYLDFLKACPNLKALTLYQVEIVSAKVFLETITTYCRKLCVLHCGYCGFSDDNEFEQLALALPPMKCLQQMYHFNPSYLMSPVFPRHFETLQAIEIRTVRDFNILRTILCSCPNLRSFFAECIDARAIESGSPWVCKRLEYLRLGIVVPFGDDHLHSVACDQLSQLKELRVLLIRTNWWTSRSRFDGRPLSLRLGEGLELLGSLKKLEHFGVGPFRVEWRDDDIKWMEKAWPELKCIYDDYQKEDEIYSRLCEHMGISRVCRQCPFFDSIDFMDL